MNFHRFIFRYLVSAQDVRLGHIFVDFNELSLISWRLAVKSLTNGPEFKVPNSDYTRYADFDGEYQF